MDITIIVGQGLAGSVLAWRMHWAGYEVHVIDSDERITASKIAAGLITPVTGRRITKSADFDALWKEAEDFYTQVEIETGHQLLERSPTERYFISSEEEHYFIRERLCELGDDVHLITDKENKPQGFQIKKAARLNVTQFLSHTRRYFSSRRQYHRVNLNLDRDIRVTPDAVELVNPEISGNRLIFCTGYQSINNPWFPGIPDAPVRGEMLCLEMPTRNERIVRHQGFWLAPSLSGEHAEREYILGATYDRQNLIPNTTDAGRDELLKGLRLITSEQATLKGHFSAVRAGTKDRQPVVRIHHQYGRLAIINGLGSKGSLLAPTASKRLMEMFSLPSTEVDSTQAKPRSLTKLAHSIARRAIKPGDLAIDATAGNGHDTVFLARCTQSGGRVLAIDRQHEAIQATQAKLAAEGVQHVETLEGDHGIILNHLKSELTGVRVIMFNLGYLPGGDKTQTTQAESTIVAIKAGLTLLAQEGVMTVIAYRGHRGGQEEATAVDDLAKNITRKDIRVDVIPGSTDNGESPILYVFRR